MKRIRITYTLKLEDGRKIAVQADNRVEAFDKMHLLFPIETDGYTYKDLEEHYAGQR